MHQIIEDPIDNAIAMVSEPNFIDSNQNSQRLFYSFEFKRISIPVIRRASIPRLIFDVQQLNSASSLFCYKYSIGENPKVDWKKEGF